MSDFPPGASFASCLDEPNLEDRPAARMTQAILRFCDLLGNCLWRYFGLTLITKLESEESKTILKLKRTLVCPFRQSGTSGGRALVQPMSSSTIRRQEPLVSLSFSNIPRSQDR